MPSLRLRGLAPSVHCGSLLLVTKQKWSTPLIDISLLDHICATGQFPPSIALIKASAAMANANIHLPSKPIYHKLRSNTALVAFLLSYDTQSEYTIWFWFIGLVCTAFCKVPLDNTCIL